MRRFRIRFVLNFYFLIICWSLLPSYSQEVPAYSTVEQITSEPQLLINGRIWHNLYFKTQGHAFFLSPEFLEGNLYFNGRRYQGLSMKYDLINDELLLGLPYQPVIIINKEMVDSFTLSYNDRSYLIVNMGEDSANVVRGYVNVLYSGKTAMFIKYVKHVHPLAVDQKFDLITQSHRIYLKKDTSLVQVQGSRGVMKLLADRNKELKQFIKSRKIQFMRRDPYTFIPVIKYYDSLTQ